MAKIIGHRGAAGLELENTLTSIRLGRKLGVDALEFDVHATRDGQLVVCHDSDLKNITTSGRTDSVDSLTYMELRAIPLKNGDYVPLLREVLVAAGDTAVIVEIKIEHHLEEICAILDDFPNLDITIASTHRSVAKTCKQLRPGIPVFLIEHLWPIQVIQVAKAMRLDGIDINFGILNPLTYWLARRAGLTIMAYTINSPAAAWIIKTFYPGVWICTDFPDRFVHHKKRTNSHMQRAK